MSAQGIAAERNPQGHASCFANLADILSGGIGWSLPKEMAKYEQICEHIISLI
ncbi:hypothetical protein [uncultured Alistipes sp.]|uniref:hypothetical protein n=1 Tax=uncultured Alistipes sp. TaxID=538949 RepID=UPI00272A42AD|nr:hypothetical protein [uncultured Alistipes sp.]